MEKSCITFTETHLIRQSLIRNALVSGLNVAKHLPVKNFMAMLHFSFGASSYDDESLDVKWTLVGVCCPTPSTQQVR